MLDSSRLGKSGVSFRNRIGASVLFLLFAHIAVSQSLAAPGSEAPTHSARTVSIKRTASSKDNTVSAKNKTPSSGGKIVSPAGKTKCWFFMQTNKIFGDCDVYACPQGLKITFSNQKWANLAKPPDWDLFVFNPKAKVYCRMPLKDWRARKLGMSFVRNLKPVGKEETIAGMRAKIYDAKPLDQERRSTRIFMVENLGLPRQVSVILCGNDAIPEMKGVPFRVQHYGGDAAGKTIETHVAKEVYVPAGFFDAPSGFRLVKKPEDVITGGISDIIEEMAR